MVGHVHQQFSYFWAHELGQELDELIIPYPDWYVTGEEGQGESVSLRLSL